MRKTTLTDFKLDICFLSINTANFNKTEKEQMA